MSSSNGSKSRRFFTVIPSPATLTQEERIIVEHGGDWPVRTVEHLPQHEQFLDFLIERSIAAWTRSKG